MTECKYNFNIINVTLDFETLSNKKFNTLKIVQIHTYYNTLKKGGYNTDTFLPKILKGTDSDELDRQLKI